MAPPPDGDAIALMRCVGGLFDLLTVGRGALPS
jgi:hypothetical protein